MNITKTLALELLNETVSKIKLNKPDEALPGQMNIFDYPEYCPDDTQEVQK